MSEFTTSTKQLDGVSVINLNGFLDAHTANVLEAAFTELINSGKFNIVVNFKNLAYISSAGLGVFMAYIENIRDNSGDIKLAEMNEKVFNIFDLLGFPLLYQIFNTEEEAINKFYEAKQSENAE
jgi:anti-sigma B factor antagonist